MIGIFDNEIPPMKATTLLFTNSIPGPFMTQVGLLILRVVTGLTMAISWGWGKVPPQEGFVSAVEGMGFPLPYFFALMAGLSEFIGGLLLAAGAVTRLAALFLGITMGVAFFVMNGIGSAFNGAGGTFSLLYFTLSVFFILVGGGKFSVDKVVLNKLTK